jgi:hypothetical protein
VGLNSPLEAGIFLIGEPRPSGRQLPETARGTSPGDHEFFCNFLLTKALPPFNMAVDKTGNGKEVDKKAKIISS